MRLLSILILLCLSLSVFAKTEILYSEHQINYIESYEQDSIWILEVFQQIPGQLQERVFRRTFTSESELLEYKSVNYPSAAPQVMSFGLMPERTFVGKEPIWEVKNQWSDDWLKKYHKWVSEEFDEEFFIKYNISTDCADVAYGLWWIFARKNALPVANHLTSSRLLFTHLSAKDSWLKLPTNKLWHKDKRFLASLNYLFNNTYTHTLKLDTYPIKLNLFSFKPGTIQLLLHFNGGHTNIVSNVSSKSNGIPIHSLSSTVPREVRKLNLNPLLLFKKPEKNNIAFLKMNWPMKIAENIWELRADYQHPDYSEEQFSSEIFTEDSLPAIDFFKYIYGEYDPAESITEIVEDLKKKIEDRIPIIEDGYLYCKSNNCSKGTSGWENWSTPSRDARIKQQFVKTEEMASLLGLINPDIYHNYKAMLKKTRVKILDSSYSLESFHFLFSKNIPSVDPTDPINFRWSVDSDSANKIISKHIKQFVAQRETKINKQHKQGLCSDCPIGSMDYKKWSTQDLDANIFNYITSKYNYCEYFNEEGCSLDLQDPLTINNSTKSIKEWEKQLLFINSDPRASNEIRWGHHQTEYDSHVLTKKYSGGSIFSNGYIVSPVGAYSFDGSIDFTFDRIYQDIYPIKSHKVILHDSASDNKELFIWDTKNHKKLFYKKNVLQLNVIEKDKIYFTTSEAIGDDNSLISSKLYRVHNEQIEELLDFGNAPIIRGSDGSSLYAGDYFVWISKLGEWYSYKKEDITSIEDITAIAFRGNKILVAGKSSLTQYDTEIEKIEFLGDIEFDFEFLNIVSENLFLVMRENTWRLAHLANSKLILDNTIYAWADYINFPDNPIIFALIPNRSMADIYSVKNNKLNLIFDQFEFRTFNSKYLLGVQNGEKFTLHEWNIKSRLELDMNNSFYLAGSNNPFFLTVNEDYILGATSDLNTGTTHDINIYNIASLKQGSTVPLFTLPKKKYNITNQRQRMNPQFIPQQSEEGLLIQFNSDFGLWVKKKL